VDAIGAIVFVLDVVDFPAIATLVERLMGLELLALVGEVRVAVFVTVTIGASPGVSLGPPAEDSFGPVPGQHPELTLAEQQ
jgi:hypothetical protein